MMDLVVQIPEESEAAPRRRRSANAPLSAEQIVRILRARYPEALLCVDTRCVNPLIATQRASYAKSNITEERRLSFVCARCRQEAAERERVAESRRVAGAANLALARAARRGTQAALREAKSAPSESDTSRAVDMTARRGGRPQIHASRKAAQRQAARAYRVRQKKVRAA